jgi:hypothetical protein
LLAVVGGNLYFETPQIIQWRGAPLIWFERADSNDLLLSLRMLTQSTEPRLWLDRNDWHPAGSLVDLQSPPNGRLIGAQYGAGDRLHVEFLDLDSTAIAAARYTQFRPDVWQSFNFPITAVEIHMQVGGTPYFLNPTESRFGGIKITGSVFVKSGVGVSIS